MGGEVYRLLLAWGRTCEGQCALLARRQLGLLAGLGLARGLSSVGARGGNKHGYDKINWSLPRAPHHSHSLLTKI